MPQKQVKLSDVIKVLRRELGEARRDAKRLSDRDPLHLDVERAEIELQVSVERDKEAEGGISIKVASLGGKAARKDVQTHTMRLVLTPWTTTPDTKLSVNRPSKRKTPKRKTPKKSGKKKATANRSAQRPTTKKSTKKTNKKTTKSTKKTAARR